MEGADNNNNIEHYGEDYTIPRNEVFNEDEEADRRLNELVANIKLNGGSTLIGPTQLVIVFSFTGGTARCLQELNILGDPDFLNFLINPPRYKKIIVYIGPINGFFPNSPPRTANRGCSQNNISRYAAKYDTYKSWQMGGENYNKAVINDIASVFSGVVSICHYLDNPFTKTDIITTISESNSLVYLSGHGGNCSRTGSAFFTLNMEAPHTERNIYGRDLMEVASTNLDKHFIIIGEMCHATAFITMADITTNNFTNLHYLSLDTDGTLSMTPKRNMSWLNLFTSKTQFKSLIRIKNRPPFEMRIVSINPSIRFTPFKTPQMEEIGMEGGLRKYLSKRKINKKSRRLRKTRKL